MGMITISILQMRKLRLTEDKYLGKGLIWPGFACRCVPPKPSPLVMVLHPSATRAMKSQMVLHSHKEDQRILVSGGQIICPNSLGIFPPV